MSDDDDAEENAMSTIEDTDNGGDERQLLPQLVEMTKRSTPHVDEVALWFGYFEKGKNREAFEEMERRSDPQTFYGLGWGTRLSAVGLSNTLRAAAISIGPTRYNGHALPMHAEWRAWPQYTHECFVKCVSSNWRMATPGSRQHTTNERIIYERFVKQAAEKNQKLNRQISKLKDSGMLRSVFAQHLYRYREINLLPGHRITLYVKLLALRCASQGHQLPPLVWHYLRESLLHLVMPTMRRVWTYLMGEMGPRRHDAFNKSPNYRQGVETIVRNFSTYHHALMVHPNFRPAFELGTERFSLQCPPEPVQGLPSSENEQGAQSPDLQEMYFDMDRPSTEPPVRAAFSRERTLAPRGIVLPPLLREQVMCGDPLPQTPPPSNEVAPTSGFVAAPRDPGDLDFLLDDSILAFTGTV